MNQIKLEWFEKHFKNLKPNYAFYHYDLFSAMLSEDSLSKESKKLTLPEEFLFFTASTAFEYYKIENNKKTKNQKLIILLPTDQPEDSMIDYFKSNKKIFNKYKNIYFHFLNTTSKELKSMDQVFYILKNFINIVKKMPELMTNEDLLKMNNFSHFDYTYGKLFLHLNLSRPEQILLVKNARKIPSAKEIEFQIIDQIQISKNNKMVIFKTKNKYHKEWNKIFNKISIELRANSNDLNINNIIYQFYLDC